ncbi:unnamed protein product [Effrenium voratum]|uniref:C2 domain-containing protein n=1 Tax=Effrenium voratum TaxID=2562239 RepID=A0AA36I623_9DINO|nr:unnamed protein product [Effrenium voratum]CAJ1425793.1 unnamed protein product [Effrenium voratum]|mmetsp:Transcript_98376/g.234193  ORF Transcript_98376/g.234193 Transcript_98376/m.234193 type:complete len:284 (-) Transcript_98376:412-1263(-)
MGALHPKCCAVQEVQNNTAEAVSEAKLVSDQPIPPLGKPLWLSEAEEYVAMQKQKEAEAAQRIQQIAAERAAEEERKAKEEEQKKEDAAAKAAKEAEKKKKTTSPKKVAAPKVPKPEEAPKPDKEKEKEPEPKHDAEAKMDNAANKAKDADMRFEFEVKCVSARGLRDADWLEGTSDPYCLCEAVGKVRSKFKTKTVNNKENPVWNQAAKMQLSNGDKLKFSVYDQDMGKSDDFLGYTELEFGQIFPKGFEGELALKDASETAVKQEAFLKVRVRHLGTVTEK